MGIIMALEMIRPKEYPVPRAIGEVLRHERKFPRNKEPEQILNLKFVAGLQKRWPKNLTGSHGGVALNQLDIRG
jgi:hypothetical protein